MYVTSKGLWGLQYRKEAQAGKGTYIHIIQKGRICVIIVSIHMEIHRLYMYLFRYARHLLSVNTYLQNIFLSFFRLRSYTNLKNGKL